MRRACLLLLLTLPACNQASKPADVAPLNAEDAQLDKSQSDLALERGNLQRERKKISDARAEIVERRKQLGHDSAGQAALDEQEKKLLAEEQSISAKEAEIGGKLDDLLKQRAELVKRATTVVGASPGGDPLERAAKREEGVAGREKAVALREKDVAERERALADRESRQAKREKEVCSGVASAPPAPIELPKGLKYTAKDVEPTYKKALKLMSDRGLLEEDLPAAAQRLVGEVKASMGKGDYVRAKYDAESLLANVEETKIDRAFISAKMARLAAAMKGRKFEGEQRKNIDQLFQDATANYGDGKFPQANSKINALFSTLR